MYSDSSLSDFFEYENSHRGFNNYFIEAYNETLVWIKNCHTKLDLSLVKREINVLSEFEKNKMFSCDPSLMTRLRELYKQKESEIKRKLVYTKPKYINMGIVYTMGRWLRASDLNLIDDGDDKVGKHLITSYYVSPYAQGVHFKIAYPYKDWMEKYIGTKDVSVKDEIEKKLKEED